MTKRAQLQDGTILEFPDETPDGVMDKAVQGHIRDNWKPTQRSPADLQANAAAYSQAHPVTGDMSAADRFVSGFGKSFVDTGQGLRQLGAAVMDKVDPRAPTLGGLVSGQDNSREAAVTADIGRQRQIDAPLMNDTAGHLGQLGGTVTQVLTPFTDAGKLVSLGGKAGLALRGAVSGGVFAGAQPVATGESRGMNTALGAGFGAGGAVVAPALHAMGASAAKAIPQEVRAVWEAAKARGISLTPAQLSDSKFLKLLDSNMRSLPFSGAAAKAEQQKAVWNQNLAGTIGSGAPVVTPDVYAGVKAAQSNQFNALAARNDMKVTPDLVRTLESHAQDAAVAGPDVAAAVRSAVDRFYSAAKTGPGGVVVPGAEYQALDSALGQVTKRGDTTAHFVGNVKGTLRDAMDASISPQDREAWNTLRQQYGNRKTIRDLVAKSDGGPISPAALQARVTANNYGKEAMATGTRGELGDLARIGQRMKEPPSSLTAERTAANSALNPVLWPAMIARSAVGSTVGRAVNSQTLASLMMREDRGKTLEGLARLVDKSKPQRLLPAAVVASRNRQQP